MKNLTDRINRPLHICMAALLPLAFTESVMASGIYVGGDNIDYRTSLNGIELDYQLQGISIGGDWNITDSIYVQYSHGRWSDSANLQNPGDSDIESTFNGVGIGYVYDQWMFYASYGVVKDEIDIHHGAQGEFLSRSDSESEVWLLEANYQWVMGAWAHTVSVGYQYDQTEMDAVINQPSMIIVDDDSDSSTANVKISTDYYFELSEQSGLFVGASLQWFEQVSGEDNQETGGQPPGGLGGGAGGGQNGGAGGGQRAGVNINRSADDGGLVGIYVGYNINPHWSVDWNSSIGVFGDAEDDSHSITLNYEF
jgi:hypothetical protein